MPDHRHRYLANCSMLVTERPLLERPRAAAEAGSDAVKLWWPWPNQPDQQVPDRAAVFRDNIDDAVGIGEQLGLAAEAVERIRATVPVESISGPKPCPLRTAANAEASLDWLPISRRSAPA